MNPSSLISAAGLTEGEAKVYLALLKLGSSTTGPIVEKSGVANSIIYRILDSLIEKGLASYIIKEKTKHFQAAEPLRLLDYIEERKAKLDENKAAIKALIPSLVGLSHETKESSTRLFEGFKGLQTAWEIMYTKLGQGEEYHSWGVYPQQEEHYHLYWQRDHVKRTEKGIKGKILFNQGTDKKILDNRNNYKGLEARYMPTSIKTPAWFAVYKDTVLIAIQAEKTQVVLIQNQLIADTFEAYFQDFWSKTTPTPHKV